MSVPISVHVREIVMGETNLFEALNQLNQLFHKMIHCFEALETPHPGDACWSIVCKCNKNKNKNRLKHAKKTAFKNPLQMID